LPGFFLYIYYFFRSVFLRGPLLTIRLLLYENHYERLFHIHTASIKKSSHQDNFHYQGAFYKILLKLFKELPPDLRQRPFIDYGSGKGRALFCAEYSGFNRLIGVELDEELVQTSLTNLKTYSQKRPESSFEIHHINALDYKIPPDAAVFYFFNPFSDKIMKEVAKKILESFKSHKRELYIVYLNPKYKEVFYTLGFKEHRIFKSNFYTEGIIFTI